MPSKFLKNYLTQLTSLFERLSEEEFGRFIEALDQAYQREANIFVFGNGGGASTASHFACDMNKGVSYGEEKKFKVICLNDNLPTLLAYANDLSYAHVFVEQIKNFMGKDDLVVGISGSGNSENVVRAIRYAADRGVATFGISGFDGGRLKDVARNSLIIRCDDMQKVEDVFIIVFHCAMQWFKEDHKADLYSERTC